MTTPTGVLAALSQLVRAYLRHRAVRNESVETKGNRKQRRAASAKARKLQKDASSRSVENRKP